MDVIATSLDSQPHRDSFQNLQGNTEEYMDLDEFFSALQDVNSITPFGKVKRHNSDLTETNMAGKKWIKNDIVIRSQLRAEKDSCPCNGKELLKSEDEPTYRQFLCDSILVNHLLSLLPTNTNQNTEKHRSNFQNKKTITLESS